MYVCHGLVIRNMTFDNTINRQHQVYGNLDELYVLLVVHRMQIYILIGFTIVRHVLHCAREFNSYHIVQSI